MARTFTYTTTSFREPSCISENQYYEIRNLLLGNPNLELDPNPESLIEHFKGQLIGIIICVLIIIILMSTTDGEGIVAPIVGISTLIGIFSIFRLFIEAPSYATYTKKRNEYFSRMKYAIQNTSSYQEFLKSFYNERLL